MAFLEIDRLEKKFGAVDVLKGISLDLDEGGFLVLVGPSGCGKSTLLNTIAGLESITSGEIRIAGRQVNDLHPSERDIAMVFQSYALYPNMTVAGNIGFGMEMRGVPKAERAGIPGDLGVKQVHGGRTHEIRHEHVGGCIVDLGRRSRLLQHAILQHRDLGGERHCLDLVMGDVDDGGLDALVEALDLGAHVNTELGIEVGQRLIEQEELGPPDQRAAHGDALALAA